MRRAALPFALVAALVAGGVAPDAAGGAAQLEARALLVEGDDPEVRVEFRLRNTGSGTLRGCIGRMWGWTFPDSDDLGARTGSRVMTPREGLPFALAPGTVYRWHERLAYQGPEAWIESVVFDVDLLPPDCKGERVGQLATAPVRLVESGAAER